MVSVEELKKKALRLYPVFLTSWLRQENFFPREIPCNKDVNFDTGEGLREMQQVIAASRASNKSGRGYSLVTQTRRTRLHSAQTLIAKIFFETAEDFLAFIRKETEFKQFQSDAKLIQKHLPVLQSWLEDNPARLIACNGKWPQLISVCRYFMEHPQPQLYLRELPVPQVDTKFIENHKAILKELLDRVLPPEYINAEFNGIDKNNFEKRFHLRYDENFVRFRILDPALYLNGLLSDLTLLSSEFNLLDFPCETVFITENKLNVLTFPAVANAIVIFGMGKQVTGLHEAAWLRKKQIFYWGDIDTFGLHILALLRKMFPHVQSMLMDSATFECFAAQRGDAPPPEPVAESLLDVLNSGERELFFYLKSLEKGNRLEQEKIPIGFVKEYIQGLPVSLVSATN